MSKLAEIGASSQNRLGRLTAMDAATIKGVIDRLVGRGFVSARADADDARRLLVDLTPLGAEVFARAAPVAHEITSADAGAAGEDEQRTLVALLRRLA